MDIKQLYNDNLRKLPKEYGDVSVMIVFVIGFLQGFKLYAQKTEVVEMNEILQLKFNLNWCLGTCQKALQFENSHFPSKMKNLVRFWNFLENAIF